ncbi:hypothetical protein HPT25_23065 [Bacillus sp. BRMEA1]|uniref:hypothetical protein n=1 Tax=Neobacillus endophyticus TaxID=2738405 RepID=UPI00156532A7|nr:hypothetical protein [Neobacillus endophyticus]NRD80215.1 hypothetical protein [Neobacillus endophyticus]
MKILEKSAINKKMNKEDRMEIRLCSDLSTWFTAYCKQNGTNKTKKITSLIEDLRDTVEKQEDKRSQKNDVQHELILKELENQLTAFKDEMIRLRAQSVDEKSVIESLSSLVLSDDGHVSQSLSRSDLKKYEIDAVNEKRYLCCPLCKTWLQARVFRQYHSREIHKMQPEQIYQENHKQVISEYNFAIKVGFINISHGKLVQINQKDASYKFSKIISTAETNKFVERMKIIELLGVSRYTFHKYVSVLEASGWNFLKMGPYKQYRDKDLDVMIKLKSYYDAGNPEKIKNIYSKNTMSLEEAALKVVRQLIPDLVENKKKPEPPFSSYGKYQIKNKIPCPLCGKWKSYGHFRDHATKDHGTSSAEIFRENRDKINKMYKKRMASDK